MIDVDLLEQELIHTKNRLAQASALPDDERRDATLELQREIRQIKRDIVRANRRNSANE